MSIKTSLKTGRRVLILPIDATVPEDVPDAMAHAFVSDSACVNRSVIHL